MRTRWRRLTLRGRLATLTAVVVSVAVILCCALAWFAARQQMSNQVDDTLRQSWSPTAVADPSSFATQLRAWCQTAGARPFDHTEAVTTVITPQEIACGNSSSAIQPTPADFAVAASGTREHDATTVLHDGRTLAGTPVRVYTVSLGPVQLGINGPQTTLAVSFAQPLEPMHRALAKLAVILTLLALLVIAGALLAAWYVTRAGLRPVDKLTAAVEHIARTEEVGTTIEVGEGEDEIARLSSSFNSMSTALASSRERQSQLIADAGHELRTPLTSLRTNVDLLVRSEDTGRPLPPETHARLLRNMKAQMGELSTLIGDLLELSRPTRQQGAKPLEVVALHDIAARALDRARLRGPGLEFTVSIDPWYVRADAHALERAVINLLDNAVKFSPAGGTIDLGLRFGTLTVRDHGPGIPEEDLSHVFERFWRSPAARQMPGSGLGLAIVSQTVQACGGEVSLSNADPGTLATMKLPGAPTPPPELPSAV
ncbi:sensor histidine kinase [Streptacidiphilus jiangxiensis]|uniref:histidine kinase n=1 Tax=Streptacidiphilus jiangxiensis TaxID=235985 RepID=A0A1H7Y231_STRJI|nr:HAMP domain-containing sensor histidine kinase [Streptacidiphilus jiangxiensis]SEM39398.1 two-component system, OmpR family, sensor histidine kinase MprB [Streptacidiphilus jiangxiensis]